MVSQSQPGAPAPQINDLAPPFMCHPREHIKHFCLAAAGGSRRSKIPARLPPPGYPSIFAFEISFDIKRWPQPRPRARWWSQNEQPEHPSPGPCGQPQTLQSRQGTGRLLSPPATKPHPGDTAKPARCAQSLPGGEGGKATAPVRGQPAGRGFFLDGDFSWMEPFPAHVPARGGTKGTLCLHFPARQERGDNPNSPVTPPGVPWGQRGPLLVHPKPPVGFPLLGGIELG